VESLVAVDDRGQMVLPKEIRERSGIMPGDKLAVVCWEKDGRVCCITLLKADLLATGVMDIIAPAMGIVRGDGTSAQGGPRHEGQ